MKQFGDKCYVRPPLSTDISVIGVRCGVWTGETRMPNFVFTALIVLGWCSRARARACVCVCVSRKSSRCLKVDFRCIASPQRGSPKCHNGVCGFDLDLENEVKVLRS